ncbi:MAG: YggS family pyridoxal phosphate-dependent enzyme [Acidimicrobiales bacterium]
MLPSLELSTVRARLDVIRERIVSAGGDPDRVTVVAVTKGHGVEAARAALGIGLTEIGENYASELADKAATVGSLAAGVVPRWHFLGVVQRNKIARLAPIVSCWQAVSRPEEASAIARHRDKAEVFIEIDVSDEPGRAGCAPAEAASVLDAALAAGCKVRGLMTVAPLAAGGDSQTTAARAFATVAGLAQTLGLDELSMGMSHDLEPAVAAGSTMVRIGTALFGERSAR